MTILARTPRVGALITARSASLRLPNKAMAIIAGAPLISHILERARASRACCEVVLCTTTGPEDDALASVAAGHGAAVYRGSRDDVARRLCEAASEFRLDHFARITGDNPFCAGAPLDAAVRSHLEHRSDYTYMTGVFAGGWQEVVSAHAIETIAERATEPGNTEYLSWYLDNPSMFRVNPIEAAPAYARSHRLTLDTPQDLEVVRAVYDALYRPGIPIDAVRALDWLDAHPEIAVLNQTVSQKLERSAINVSLRS